MARFRSLTIRHASAIALALIVLVAVSAGQALNPQRAKAREVSEPVQVGVTFSHRRAAALGLDYRATYEQVLQMHFRVVRLAAYWDEVDAGGYGALDWLMQRSAAAGQPVVLTVGMKSLGWPEFYIPQRYQPAVPPGGDVSHDAALSSAALAFVSTTVERYRGYGNIVRWQVENEPFNRAGPNRWWIGAGLLAREVETVRSLDRRPFILNVFGHFDMALDQMSSRNGMTLAGLLGFDADSAERDSLALLRAGDTLGFDVYTRIGYRVLGREAVATASQDWDEYVARWRETAAAQAKATWVTEMQAEPWEADPSELASPRSFAAGDMQRMFADLKDTGQRTVMLWGAEYWFWRLQNGDPTWIEAGRQILRDEARAPQIASG